MPEMKDPDFEYSPTASLASNPGSLPTPDDRMNLATGPKSSLIRVNPEGLSIIDKFRGDLSREVFVLTLLRIIDTDAMRDLPTWNR